MVGRGIALLFHDRGTRRGVSGQQHAPAALYPRERPGIHFTGGWVGPRAGVWTGGKSRPHRDSIPHRPARSSVAIPNELPGQLSHIWYYYYYYLSGKGHLSPAFVRKMFLFDKYPETYLQISG